MLESVRKAVFPAAGLGTRFLPATKSLPKEMLPLVDKPIIQYGVEEAVASGIGDIVIVTGRGKSAIEDHFDVSFELEYLLEARGQKALLEAVRAISVNVAYIRQSQALGLGHAVLQSRDLVGDEAFAVVLADDVIVAPTPCLAQLLAIHKTFRAPVVAVMEVPPEQSPAYGMVEAEQVSERVFRVRDLVEKPKAGDSPSNLAIIGRYILTPRIFDSLACVGPGAGSEIQLTDGLKHMLRETPLYAYKFEGTRYDAGDKLGFLKATVELALRRADLGPKFRDYLRALPL